MAVVTYNATGRRKSSVARVRLVPGEGKIVINGRELTNYFGLKTLELIVNQPLEITETKGKYDVLVNVIGGGVFQVDRQRGKTRGDIHQGKMAHRKFP